MKKLTYFYMRGCPYCRAADGWLNELRAEDPRYAAVEIERVEENEQRALADSYDYYYVPSFFIGSRKLHEGAATREKIKAVMEACVDG